MKKTKKHINLSLFKNLQMQPVEAEAGQVDNESVNILQDTDDQPLDQTWDKILSDMHE